MKSILMAALLLQAALSSIADAQTDTIYAEYKYTMGDNDSKADARQLAFLYAKKLCLEKAGTYVVGELKVMKKEALGAVSNYSELTQQDITTFSAAFVSVDVLSENFEYVGQSIAITTKVRAVVSVQSVLDRIVAVRDDKEQAEQIKKQQAQLDEMETRLRELQKKLTSGSVDLVDNSRVQRQETFGKISEIEKIREEIAAKTRLAVENIELGMTEAEVKRLIGEPRSRSVMAWNYGKVWILFESGLVSGIVRGYQCKWDFRRQFESYNPELIIK